METIHKKNGRLHIYVRQDKYKGELKSHNWVGRTYINGKQKVSSSGTTNLEEAIPILEKWYDELHAEKDNSQPEIGVIIEEENLVPSNEELNVSEPIEIQKFSSDQPSLDNVATNTSKKGLSIAMLEKLKNIKFSNEKKDEGSADNQTTSVSGDKKNKDNKIKSLFKTFAELDLSNITRLSS